MVFLKFDNLSEFFKLRNYNKNEFKTKFGH